MQEPFRFRQDYFPTAIDVIALRMQNLSSIQWDIEKVGAAARSAMVATKIHDDIIL